MLQFCDFHNAGGRNGNNGYVFDTWPLFLFTSATNLGKIGVERLEKQNDKECGIEELCYRRTI